MIKQLHHSAYRCRDSEETRAFYEDFLGLPLVASLTLTETKTGRTTRALHTFFRLDNGAHLAFFEAPDFRDPNGRDARSNLDAWQTQKGTNP